MDNEEKKPETYIDSQVVKADLKQKIYEETKLALQTEQRFTDFLGGYEESSVASFIEYYAHNKATWITNGESMVKLRSHFALQWRQKAFIALQQIQEKKLFNLECEWRAERIKLPGIEICADFYFARLDIINCAIVPPVTEEELNHYIDFLEQLSDTYDAFGDFDIGSDTRRLRANYYDTKYRDGDYPAWYRYYDSIYGTDILLALPDIRHEKEQVYKKHWYDKNAAEWEAARATQKPPIKTLYDREFAEWFLTNFDTKETLRLYRSDREWKDEMAFGEDIEMELIDLGEAKVNVPVRDDDDWRKGIKRAAEMYYRKMTIIALPHIWKEYRERLAAGKPAMEREEYYPGPPQEDLSSREQSAKHILDGRELNGEPRDLNF